MTSPSRARLRPTAASGIAAGAAAGGGAAPERAAVLENLLAEVKELEDQLF